MEREQIQILMADYLGGELAPDMAEDFKTSLERYPDLSAEVMELRNTLQALGAVRGPISDIHTKDLYKQDNQQMQDGASSVYQVVKRYAAVILIAFIAGYISHMTTLEPLANQQFDDTDKNFASQTDSIINRNNEKTNSNDDWRNEFAEVYMTYPSDSSLARSFVALSKTSRQ